MLVFSPRLFRSLIRQGVLLLVFSAGLIDSSQAVSKSALPQPEEPTLEEKLIQRNVRISQWFDGLAEGLDLFFVGKRLTREKNKTRVTLENITFSEESRNLKNNFVLGIYPRFPNLEKYWALKMTSFDEREYRRAASNNFSRQPNRTTNYGATAVWYRRFGSVRTSFEPRIEFQNPVRISHSVSFESVANFDSFVVNPRLELYASSRKGPGVFQALYFNFNLGQKWSLTQINEGDYLDKARLFSVNNGFSFGQLLSQKSTLSYNFFINSLSRPQYHLHGYTVSVSYNELVYKNVFDYTVTPYMEWTRPYKYRGRVGAVVNLRLIF
jgi:hypothetical protein